MQQTNSINGEQKIIAYASRALTDEEKRYAQIEREALAIYISCIEYRIYLLGKAFDIVTDHKPLLYMFNNPNRENPYRVERIRMKLQGYDFTVKHVSGVKNPSDFMSRKPAKLRRADAKRSEELEKHVHWVLKDGPLKAVTLQEIKESTSRDTDLKLLTEAIFNGKKYKLDANLDRYKRVFHSLSVFDGIILKGRKIVVPKELRGRVVAAAHEGHQGIDKTKELLRAKVWYPGIDKDVKSVVSNCIPCQASVNSNDREPLNMTELPSAPWESLATDFYGPLSSGEYLLTIVDEYSRFLLVKIVSSISAKATIPKFDEVFSEFGIPACVKSDNGSPFNSREFADFAKHMGFKHKPITPMYPQANGIIERVNGMIKKVVMTAKIEKRNWKQQLFAFLRNYRCTPHSTTGEAPVNLLFGKRNFCTRIPEIRINENDDSALRNKDSRSKAKIKAYADRKSNVKISTMKIGDSVLVKKRRICKSDPYYDPDPYVITKKNGNMITAERANHMITRNSSFFKVIGTTRDPRGNTSDSEVDDYQIIERNQAELLGRNEEEILGRNEVVNDSHSEEEEANDDGIPRRSTRVTGQPVRYPMDVPL